MFSKVVERGGRAVVISADGPEGPFEYRLYVNAGEGLGRADATPVRGRTGTLEAAERAASARLDEAERAAAAGPQGGRS